MFNIFVELPPKNNNVLVLVNGTMRPYRETAEDAAAKAYALVVGT
jgi:hypothetical protein